MHNYLYLRLLGRLRFIRKTGYTIYLAQIDGSLLLKPLCSCEFLCLLLLYLCDLPFDALGGLIRLRPLFLVLIRKLCRWFSGFLGSLRLQFRLACHILGQLTLHPFGTIRLYLTWLLI